MPTTSEKRSLRVYCLIALRAKMSSRNSGVNVFSNKAHTIIITGSRSFHNLNSSSSMEGILHPPEKKVLLPHTCVVPSTLKWLLPSAQLQAEAAMYAPASPVPESNVLALQNRSVAR